MQCIYHYAEITAENNVYRQNKIYVVHMSQGSVGYRSISAARSWPQQQTCRPALLLWISGTEEWTVDRFMTLGIERHVDCIMCLSWVVKWMPVFFSYSVIVVYNFVYTCAGHLGSRVCQSQHFLVPLPQVKSSAQISHPRGGNLLATHTPV